MTAAASLLDAEQAVAYQEQALLHVSRTFALTIPQLPQALREVVGNAYLLCRIADTIEDEPALSVPDKVALLREFSDVVAGRAPAEPFATHLLPGLSDATADGEKELVRRTPVVTGLTHGFNPAQRAAIERCIDVMTVGMSEFGGGSRSGLETPRNLERYTYCVAGVVGEMITDLVCDYSKDIAARRDRLYPLAAQFGHGLQLVNILKDVWEDQRRGVCWLPRAAFPNGVDLSSPATRGQPGFVEGLTHLVATAQGYLDAAFAYTVLIPARETGIRRFLLWTLGLAVLTLRRIHGNPRFASGAEVKVPRGHVRAIVLTTSAAARSAGALRWLFRRATAPLPRPEAKGASEERSRKRAAAGADRSSSSG